MTATPWSEYLPMLVDDTGGDICEDGELHRLPEEDA